VFTSISFVPPGAAAYFASVLRALGYRVRVHLVPFGTITTSMRERFQLSADGDWLADCPDPSYQYNPVGGFLADQSWVR
jgi:hypothetical protein